MRRVFLQLFILSSLTGCVTARLSNGPDASPLIQQKDMNRVEIAAALDERDSETIGTIGATAIQERKADLANLMSNHLMRYIHEKVGLNVERVQMTEADLVKLVATQNKMNGVIVLRIKELKMHSQEVRLKLELTVFDDSGAEVYRRTVRQHYEEQLDASAARQSTNELMEITVKDALKQYVEDPALKKIIAKFKYGTVGGVIAGVF